ncbi:MAG: Vms1/Ankzf1 family peptidyl-tRNA hydrolase [Pseudonocardiaceae bacterium]
MLPEIPRELAVHPGPIASIYLEVSRDRDGAPQQVRLRWQALAAQLREQGADEKTIDAASGAALEPHSQPGGAGRAVFAADGRVLHQADLPKPPRREFARWATLPHLLPLLAQLPEYVPHVMVRLGRTTATITGFDRTGREVLDGPDKGQNHPVHKTGGGGAAHYSMQHRTEEVWARNARAFAADVDRAVATLHAELVVLTGDVRARSLVRDELGEHSQAITEQVPGPGPDDHTTDHTVDDEVRRLAAERAADRTRKVIEQFEQELGRSGGLGVTGLGPVVHGLQRNQVDTVLLRDDPTSELRIWIGPEPMQLALTEDELREIGAPVLGQDRADAALIRAMAGSGADLVLLPPSPHNGTGDNEPEQTGSAAGGAPPPGGQSELADGIGALLRFTTP